ncbi:MAG: adenylate/guanylate cyclase domain-containing protein [Thermoproteota archaeon]|jgi:class 3 adenylate cyclase|nr:adenylate/guanylate cyclase domain-containing protein [Thermoproteota archaeon]
MADSQQQTIINLYNSGIPPEIIAFQLDISQEEVGKVIQTTEERGRSANQTPEVLPMASFYLDAVVDLDKAISMAQQRVWKALKVESRFDISTEETYEILAKYSKSKVMLVILHIDLVGSTRLSSDLPADRLAAIIQAFIQEMSITISAYGGFVLKYVGDAILAFFLANDDKYLPCVNAVNCARSMIRIIREGINPILNQYDYAEMNVRIGIDLGENVVVQYGWDTFNVEGKKLKRPHFDILGYTINIATKMTTLAKPDQIVIGQIVYDFLDDRQKSTFHRLQISPDVWGYMSDYSGGIYPLYGTYGAYLH